MVSSSKYQIAPFLIRSSGHKLNNVSPRPLRIALSCFLLIVHAAKDVNTAISKKFSSEHLKMSSYLNPFPALSTRAILVPVASNMPRASLTILQPCWKVEAPMYPEFTRHWVDQGSMLICMGMPRRTSSAIDFWGGVAIPIVLLGWWLLVNSVMGCRDVLGVPMKRRVVESWPGKFKVVMLGSNDGRLRVRLLTAVMAKLC